MGEDGRLVLIAVDDEDHSQRAFECKFFFLISAQFSNRVICKV